MRAGGAAERHGFSRGGVMIAPAAVGCKPVLGGAASPSGPIPGASLLMRDRDDG
jgi:hypothetical protein